MSEHQKPSEQTESAKNAESLRKLEAAMSGNPDTQAKFSEQVGGTGVAARANEFANNGNNTSANSYGGNDIRYGNNDGIKRGGTTVDQNGYNERMSQQLNRVTECLDKIKTTSLLFPMDKGNLVRSLQGLPYNTSLPIDNKTAQKLGINVGLIPNGGEKIIRAPDLLKALSGTQMNQNSNNIPPTNLASNNYPNSRDNVNRARGYMDR
ncbi:MAG: hypothetical protein WC774_00225 [Candidatus Gracilibacteria bacterium]